MLAVSNPGAAPSFVLREGDSNGLPHLLKNFSQELTLCQRNYGTFLKTWEERAQEASFKTHTLVTKKTTIPRSSYGIGKVI